MSLPEPGSLYLRLTRMPVKDQRIAEFALLLAIAIVLPVVAIMQVPA